MSANEPTRIVVVAGLAADCAREVADGLNAASSRTVTVHHDLSAAREGVIRREVRTASRVLATPVELVRCCLSCTLREDVLRVALGLAETGRHDRIVLHLDPGIEPEPVCWALSHALVGDKCVTDVADIEGVITTIDQARWLEQATSAEPVPSFAAAFGESDDRTLAQIAVSQAEFADVLVTSGAVSDDPTTAVLTRLAPLASRVPEHGIDHRSLLDDLPAEARRGRCDDAHGPLLQGQPPLEHEHGVALTLFSARRPFHPERLEEATDALVDGVVRSRGRIWLATQPDEMLWIESAGAGMRAWYSSPWFSSLGGHEHEDADWESLSPVQSAMKSLNWDPYYGDREQQLVIITHSGTDPDDIVDALQAALLTDDELAEGEAAWLRYRDPFKEASHTDSAEDTTTGSGSSGER
ncbi:ribosome hibernation factor-recruiting GTPase MRF [Saccharopolyspora sp. 6V]|uniref:ribosome hibernation factor-recruiting GTPase MRF n=1 Tax=Saccharopolyspora sp. 6V TaxID=2877239 RepID=UPI001CD60ED1|nr:GTP-binding protein [Saccharopolyspora sp. 6V]MCA1192861.1 GTP-binding protein [Saccharopolyspora sp. 6V]